MLAFFVIIPVLIAVLLFIFSNNQSARGLAIPFQSIFVIFVLHLFITTYGEESTTLIGAYENFMGIHLRAYHLSTVFILLTAIIFLAIAIYSFHETTSRTFWFLLFILEATLVGLFLTRDLFNVFVLVEVGTIIMAILLMYNKKKRNLYQGLVFIMANVIAMVLYLWGLGYLYQLTGVFDMMPLTQLIAHIEPNQLVLPYSLIMTALAFKCAMIPLFSFTPKTSLYPAAPSAVTAILSGVQIKTTIYLLFRMQEIFGGFSNHRFFLILGITASLTAVFMAISQSDIKLILAYHTISQVGLIIIGLSLENNYSTIGGFYHMIAHGIFKSALFLTAGIIYRTYQTRDVYEIKGVMKRMPLVGIASLFAILGIMGAPFFIGFTSKYFIAYDVPLWVNLSTITISLGTIISFIKYSGMLFGTWEGGRNYGIGEDLWRLIPAIFLGSMSLLGGIFGVPIINYLFVENIRMSSAGIFQKTTIFFVSVGVGYFIYKKTVYNNAFLKKIANTNFSFKQIVAAMGLFLGIMIVIVGSTL